MAITSDDLTPDEFPAGALVLGDEDVPAPIGDPLAMDPDAIDRLSSLARRRPPRPGAPFAVAVAVAALWAALTSYLPLLALAVLGGIGSGAGFGGSIRLAGWGWLLGFGVPVQTPADQITLIPLAITALSGWRLVRAGVHASRAVGGQRRRALGPALGAAAGVALGYALIGAMTAWLLSTADVAVSPVRAAGALGLFAGLASGIGAVGRSRAGRAGLRRVLRAGPPGLLGAAVRTGACAAALMLAAGAAISGAALALNGSAATSMLESYRAGVGGQAAITALCLVYAPNAAVWGTAYLLGPGFAVGAGTVVSPGDVLIGPLPGFPLLAGLPTVPLTGLGPALLGLPVVAGILAGVLLARRSTAGWGPLLATAGLSGVFGGLLVQLAGYAATGALGAGRLARFGAVDWRVGLVAAGVTTVGALIGAAAVRVLRVP